MSYYIFDKKLLYVIIFSFSTAFKIFFNKLALDRSANPLLYISQATLISLILLTIFIIFKNIRYPKKISSIVLNHNIVFVGIFTGLTFIIGIYSLELSNSINYSFLIKSSIIFIIIFGYFFLKEIIDKKKTLLVFTFIAGTYLIIIGNEVLKARIGDLLAILTALCFSVALIIQKSLTKKYSPDLIAWGRIFFASILMSLLICITKINIFDIQVPKLVVLAGIASTTEAIYLIKTVSISSASYLGMMSMMIPLINTLLGLIFLGELITSFQIIGAILIIFSGFLVQKYKI